MYLAYLYTKSELTPWKENVNETTLTNLVKNTPMFSRSAVIHFDGFTDLMRRNLLRFDLVFNLSYGFGEAGQVEVAAWLEENGILHTASSVESMSLAQDKALLPFICGKTGISTPEVIYSCDGLDDDTVYISKPRKGSCHRNIHIETGKWMKNHLLPEFSDLIIQPYIPGREFSVAVIPTENGSQYTALPPVEIIPAVKGSIFIAGQQYGKTLRELNPDLSMAQEKNLMSYAWQLHKNINLRGMSRTDFRMSPDGTIYVLDVNAMPNLDPEKSLLPALCQHHGISIQSLISRMINNAVFFADYIEEDNRYQSAAV
jgi:D-alanine-D-alanine ligase